MTKLLCGAARLAAGIRHSRTIVPVTSGSAMLLVAGGLFVFPGSSAADHGGGSAEVAPGPEAFSKPEVRRGLDEGRERSEGRRRDRDTPEARNRRRESRRAYRGRSRDEALAIARQKHRSVLTAWPWEPLRLRDGQEVKAYRGDYSALVSAGGGRDLLAESTLPLRALDESGELEPVNLNLEERGLDYVPSNPLIDVRVSKNPTVGISFERAGFRFGLEGAALTGPPVLTEGKAFWGNVATDMDMLVRPVPLGVETFFVLRSAESPESATLTFQLPPGARLQAAGGSDRAVDIVQGAEVIGRVEAPVAYDAEGEAVGVSYDVQGSKLVVQFPHRAGDHAYPLMVDPIVGDTVKENFNLDGSGRREYPNDPFSGWAFFENAPSGFFPHYVSTDNANRGLVVYAWQGGDYRDGYYGEWYWQAPRQSYIERADFGYVDHTAPWGTCLLEGIYSPSRGNWEYGRWSEANGTSGSSPTITSPEACSAQNANYKAHCVGNSCIPHNPPSDPRGTPGNLMVVGLYKNGNHILGSWPTVRMEGATMWLFDNDVPNMGAPQHSNLPAGWTSSATVTTGLTATEPDPGLGVKHFNLYRGENFDTFIDQRQHPCSGDRHGRCPVSWSIPDLTTDNAYRPPGRPVEKNVAFSYNTDSLPEGVNTLKAVAYDAVGKWGPASIASWTVKVDRSGPTLDEPTGSLYDRRNKTVNHESEGLYEADFDVTARASDPHSGVKTLKIAVDGQVKTAYEPGCDASSGCPTSSPQLSWTFHADDYADGEHTVTVTATDAAGNEATGQEWTVTVDRRGDIYQAREYTGDPSAGGKLVASEWAKARTRIARREDPDYVQSSKYLPCPSGSNETCSEVRYRTRFAEQDPSAGDSYTVYTGPANDQRLEVVADIVVPWAKGNLGDPKASGPLVGGSAALQGWQIPPPAHSGRYDAYETQLAGDFDGDGTTENATQELWLEAATMLPLRERVSIAGEVLYEFFYGYERGRLEDGQVPADHFQVARPAKVDEEHSVEFRGDAASGGQAQAASANAMVAGRSNIDQQTGTSFPTYYLGPQPRVAAGTFCFAGENFVMEGALPFDEDEAPLDLDGSVDLSAPITYARTYYQPVGADGLCGELQPDETPVFSVRSVAKGSSYAEAIRHQYVKTGSSIQTDPLNEDFTRSGIAPVLVEEEGALAYVLRISNTTSGAIVEKGNTLIEVTGPFDKTTAGDVMRLLEAR